MTLGSKGLSFLTRVFRTEWLAISFSIFWRGNFWTVFLIMEFILSIFFGRHTNQMSVLRLAIGYK